MRALFDINFNESESWQLKLIWLCFEQSPRRNCCRIQDSKRKGTMVIDVGECREDEAVEL